jgi:phage gpG-like protein
MADRVVVQVEGLKEFRKALRDADRALGPELRKGLNQAADIVVKAARPKIAVQTGRLQKSLRARSSQREGIVVLGSARLPYAGWWEFGGKVPHGPSKQFIPTGRALFPAAKERNPEIMAEMERIVDGLARKAGLS